MLEHENSKKGDDAWINKGIESDIGSTSKFKINAKTSPTDTESEENSDDERDRKRKYHKSQKKHKDDDKVINTIR